MTLKPSELHTGERIVLDLHPHAIVLTKSIVALLISIVAGLLVRFGWNSDGNVYRIVSWLVIAAIVVSLVYFLTQWISMMTTQFIVTTDRCVFRDGIFAKSGVEIPLSRINTVFFHQTILERMVGCGMIALESAGEKGTATFEHVRDPVKVQHTIYEQIKQLGQQGQSGQVGGVV